MHVSIHQSADTFFAKIPLDNSAGLDETFWADTAPIPVTISGSNDIGAGGFTDLITGQIDETLITLHDRTVQVRGRDKTALLTEMKTSEQWLNRTDKDIITDLAGRAGLTVSFSGEAGKAGLQYDQDFNELSDLDSGWNVVVALAKKAGCIAFVKGATLYVQPIDADPLGVYAIDYQRPLPGQRAASKGMMLTCVRNLNLAKGVIVNHKSWRHKQGQTVESEFEAPAKNKTANAQRDTTIYRFRGANLTKLQQDRIAKSRLKETLSHERVVDIDMPGDVAIDPRMALKLSGTGTKFDQSFIIADITHRFTRDGGYQMTVSGHNVDASRGPPKQNK